MRRLAILALILAAPAFAEGDPLPSWNEGPAKQAILDFVAAAGTEGGPDSIAPADRIAVFDNDGTLWSEQPMYFQGMFINDRIKAMAADHPEWATTQPFKAVLEGDTAALGAGDLPRFDREPGVFFIDDKVGKPVGILRHIGREPASAFGNSDGDYQMLDYVTGGDGPFPA